MKRTDRVGPLIFEEISQILLRKLEDPRLRGVTFTKVTVSADLKLARCYFSLIGDKEQAENALAALTRAKGIFKRAIGKNLNLRYTPELEFFHDENPAYADKIERILIELKKDGQIPPADNEDETGD